MADPLSIAAGIIAVLGATGATFKALQNAWELRHMNEDFIALLNEVTGLKTQLQVVETSLTLIGERDISNGPLKKCLESIEHLRGEASAVLVEIDKFVQKIMSKRQAGQKSGTTAPKPSKRKWMRRKYALARLTAKVAPIVSSLTAAAGILRAITSDQTLHRMNTLLTTLSIQNVSIIMPETTIPDTATNVADPIETRLDAVLRQSIDIEMQAGLSSRRSSIDSFHSAMSSSSDSSPSIMSLTGTLVNDNCEPFCPCQCHVTSQLRTPQWVKSILGSMSFHGNASLLLSRRPCNKSCRRSGPSTVQFTYFAPAWTLLRSFNFYVKAQCLRGLDFNIRMPRVIPPTSVVWSVIELGKLVALKEMIEGGATSPFDVSTTGKSVLNYAAFKGQDGIYTYLLSVGADPSLRDEKGITANQPGVDRALTGTALDREVGLLAPTASYDLFINTATLDQQGFTLLHLIVLRLYPLDLALVLKQYPSDIDVPDINGRTPLIWAAWRGDIESVDLLLNARGPINWADIDRVDHEGYSALIRAAEAGHLDCVRRLLQAHASVSNTDAWGLQPIHHASGNKLNGLAIVNELLEWGADVNASSENGTPLHEAANRGAFNTVKCLIARGANIDAADPDGDTPSMVSLVCWNESTFRYLAEVGAKLNCVNKAGENVVQMAIWCGSAGLWHTIVDYARSGRMEGIDLNAQHHGHDMHHCFRTCRTLLFVGKREAKGKEEAKFEAMMSALYELL